MSPLNQVKEIWNRLPNAGKIATAAAGVATLGLMLALIYYGSQPEYGVLFSDLKPADAQTIVEKLKTENVAYSLSNGGTTIQVPTANISELRLKMAGTGVLSGGHVGFDLFDKTNFGATDFTQQVNYRRAIEGELSRTLEGMDEVESVRVHITPKKESVFSEKEEGAKASVMLRVRQGKELSSERTEAIVSLVASSVEGLDPASVSVMDTRGRLLTSGRGKSSSGAGDVGMFNAQLEAKQKFQAESAARVIALLEPVVGEGKVRADVAADIDFSQIEQTEEKYNPQSQVVRSQQTSQENKSSALGNALNGAVGVRSNDPTTPPQTTQTQNNNDQRNATTTNYEIDKTVRRTVGGGGRVNRMTVSVVVDHKTAEGVDVARTGEEIQKIQELVAAAVGIDANRGDSVVIQSMAFNRPSEELAASASWLDKNKSLVSAAIKYLALIAVAALIFFFVVRPAKKHLKAAALAPADKNLLPAASAQERRTADALSQNPNEADGNQPMLTVAELEAQMENENGVQPVANQIHRGEQIKKLLAEQTISNPETVAGTLRGWLREA